MSLQTKTLVIEFFWKFVFLLQTVKPAILLYLIMV